MPLNNVSPNIARTLDVRRGSREVGTLVVVRFPCGVYVEMLATDPAVAGSRLRRIVGSPYPQKEQLVHTQKDDPFVPHGILEEVIRHPTAWKRWHKMHQIIVLGT